MINEIKLKSYSKVCHQMLGDRFCSIVPAYRLLYFSSKFGRYLPADPRLFTLDMARFLLVDMQTLFPNLSFILTRI